MSELRAGGLAIIVMSVSHENLGKVVTLIEFIGSVDKGVHKSRNDIWRIRAANSLLRGFKGEVLPGEIARCPGAWLMPIDGEDFSHEDERQKELTHG